MLSTCFLAPLTKSVCRCVGLDDLGLIRTNDHVARHELYYSRVLLIEGREHSRQHTDSLVKGRTVSIASAHGIANDLDRTVGVLEPDRRGIVSTLPSHERECWYSVCRVLVLVLVL